MFQAHSLGHFNRPLIRPKGRPRSKLTFSRLWSAGRIGSFTGQLKGDN
jgi:hypothetical protein